MKYFVHYTILNPKGADKHLGVSASRCVAGPYTMDDALAAKQMFEGPDQQALNVYIAEDATCYNS